MAHWAQWRQSRIKAENEDASCILICKGLQAHSLPVFKQLPSPTMLATPQSHAVPRGGGPLRCNFPYHFHSDISGSKFSRGPKTHSSWAARPPEAEQNTECLPSRITHEPHCTHPLQAEGPCDPWSPLSVDAVMWSAGCGPGRLHTPSLGGHSGTR